MMSKYNTKCGYVSIIGPPNAGKSTLINELIGSKVSIVSPKVQTTRIVVRGIYTNEENQIIFIDTPGIINNPKRLLEKAMVSSALKSSRDSDVCLIIFDCSIPQRVNIEYLDLIKEGIDLNLVPVYLVLNKIDKIKKENLLQIVSILNKNFNFENTFIISSINADGTKDLLNFLLSQIPDGPWLYNEDDIIDLPERQYAAEITREKLFYYLHNELPYQCTVETENWIKNNEESIRIEQTIFITRENHKGIILGSGGSNIKKIGEESRKDLEKIFNKKIHLFLHVKVDAKWFERSEYYKTWNIK